LSAPDDGVAILREPERQLGGRKYRADAICRDKRLQSPGIDAHDLFTQTTTSLTLKPAFAPRGIGLYAIDARGPAFARRKSVAKDIMIAEKVYDRDTKSRGPDRANATAATRPDAHETDPLARFGETTGIARRRLAFVAQAGGISINDELD